MVNTRSKTKSTQPESLVGSNDDLLTEILIRLPVTSILRFKSVSRHWRSLLTHTHFAHRYDNLSKTPGLFARGIYIPFNVENRSTPPFRSLEFYFNRPRVIIMQHCNGLLLCCSHLLGDSKYYVFNPTTKQLAIIPPLRGGENVRKTICFMALAFHQTVRYEVVCIRALDPHGKKFQIQIYSSETREWRVSIECLPGIVPAFGHAVYWNGAIHWASFPSPFNFNCELWCFKTDSELLRKLPLPEGLMSYEILTMYFGESRGHLHLIVYNIREGKRLRVNVYEMLRDYSRWFVKYRVELDELPDAFPEMVYLSGDYNFKVVDVVRGEDEEDTFMVLKINQKVITYNVHHKSFKQIFSLPDIFLECSPGFHRYTETLSSF
ncbi:F-box protein At5g07610-like [Bidens hawaiensis]|uniref:F-box protein At5g07610-like n=1 Tax=Bidens hawaiensis TaxID=980011 RepID=UPI00404B3047